MLRRRQEAICDALFEMRVILLWLCYLCYMGLGAVTLVVLEQWSVRLARLLISLFPVVFDTCVNYYWYLFVSSNHLVVGVSLRQVGEEFSLSWVVSAVECWFSVLLIARVWIWADVYNNCLAKTIIFWNLRKKEMDKNVISFREMLDIMLRWFWARWRTLLQLGNNGSFRHHGCRLPIDKLRNWSPLISCW